MRCFLFVEYGTIPLMVLVFALRYLFWHFFEAPSAFLTAWKNILWYNLHYFSVGFLLKTLFAPWRRYQWEYGKGQGFSVGRYAEVFFSNLMSRSIGAVVRLFLVVAGLLVEATLLLCTLPLLLLWFSLPLVSITAVSYGLFLFF